MSAAGSVTYWIAGLKAGDPGPAQQLWQTYFHRLVVRARPRLAGMPRRAADEEDVALSAFDSFCRGAEQGRFPKLHDRSDLWQLLVVITDRKAVDLVHHERRARRGGGQVLDEAALTGADSSTAFPFHGIAGREPSPEFAALLAEQCQRLLACLDDEELRSVALWKLEGYTIEEIAAKLGCVARTVDRRLRLIRSTWEKESAHE
jgi:DNA-directed RNA polymerase specialized sigma24 family protein